MAMPWAANDATVSGCSPQACSTQSVPAAARSRSDSSPKQCAVTRAPSSCAAATACAEHVGRPARREVAGVAVDPVADQLDPAVAGAGLEPHLLDELLGLDLPGEVADVAPGAGDVPAGPHQARQVVAVLHPAGVGGRAGVAQQQGTGSPGRPAPAPPPSRRRRRPAAPEADVAVRVDQAGQHPARHGGDVVVAGGGGIRDAATDHPRLRAHVVGADEDRTGEVQHLSHGPTLVVPPAGGGFSRRSPARGCSACPAR